MDFSNLGFSDIRPFTDTILATGIIIILSVFRYFICISSEDLSTSKTLITTYKTSTHEKKRENISSVKVVLQYKPFLSLYNGPSKQNKPTFLLSKFMIFSTFSYI